MRFLPPPSSMPYATTAASVHRGTIPAGLVGKIGTISVPVEHVPAVLRFLSALAHAPKRFRLQPVPASPSGKHHYLQRCKRRQAKPRTSSSSPTTIMPARHCENSPPSSPNSVPPLNPIAGPPPCSPDVQPASPILATVTPVAIPLAGGVSLTPLLPDSPDPAVHVVDDTPSKKKKKKKKKKHPSPDGAPSDSSLDPLNPPAVHARYNLRSSGYVPVPSSSYVSPFSPDYNPYAEDAKKRAVALEARALVNEGKRDDEMSPEEKDAKAAKMTRFLEMNGHYLGLDALGNPLLSTQPADTPAAALPADTPSKKKKQKKKK
jgi:hypothetical protein